VCGGVAELHAQLTMAATIFFSLLSREEAEGGEKEEKRMSQRVLGF